MKPVGLSKYKNREKLAGFFERTEIPIYRIKLSNNQIKITDDGWAIDYLQSKGFDVEHDSKLKLQVLAILKPRSVKLKDNELIVITDNRKAVEAKDKLKLAIVAVITVISGQSAYTSFFEKKQSLK